MFPATKMKREKKKLNSFIKFDFLLASFCIKMPTMAYTAVATPIIDMPSLAATK
jgi:hypothetical protein